MAPCDTVTKRALPCESHGSLQKFKISASDFIQCGCIDSSAHAHLNFLILVLRTHIILLSSFVTHFSVYIIQEVFILYCFEMVYILSNS